MKLKKQLSYFLWSLCTIAPLLCMQEVPLDRLTCACCKESIEHRHDHAYISSTQIRVTTNTPAPNNFFHIHCALAQLLEPRCYIRDLGAYQRCSTQFKNLIGGCPRFFDTLMEQLKEQKAPLEKSMELLTISRTLHQSTEKSAWAWKEYYIDQSKNHRGDGYANGRWRTLLTALYNFSRLYEKLQSHSEPETTTDDPKSVLAKCSYCHADILKTDLALNVRTDVSAQQNMHASHARCLATHLKQHTELSLYVVDEETPVLVNAPCYYITKLDFPPTKPVKLPSMDDWGIS